MVREAALERVNHYTVNEQTIITMTRYSFKLMNLLCFTKVKCNFSSSFIYTLRALNTAVRKWERMTSTKEHDTKFQPPEFAECVPHACGFRQVPKSTFIFKS